MKLSPTAQAIHAHLQTRESATMAHLRRVTGLPTQETKAAALELCRAGLCMSEWHGMRFRLRERARVNA